MTALCGGGASQAKPGAQSQIVLTASLVTGALLAVQPWLFPFAALLDTFAYNAATQCTSDPPAMPVFTTTDALALGLPLADPSATTTALGKIQDVLLNWAWYQYCQCAAGSPTAPTYPTEPANSQVAIASSAINCFTSTFQGSGQADYIGFTGPWLNFGQLTPSGPVVMETMFGLPAYAVTLPIGAGGQPFSFTYQTTPVSTGGGHVQGVAVDFYDSSGALAGSINGNVLTVFSSTTTSQTGSYQGTVPTNAVAVNVNVRYDTRDSPPIQTVVASWFNCAGAGSSSQCCSDPVVLAMLQAIWKQLQGLANAEPTAYSESTVHAGLSGSGTISIAAGTIAVKATITTDTNGRIDAGSPDYLFDRGYIVQIAAEAPLRGYSRLVYNPQVFKLDPICEQLGYTLPGGEVITITELVLAA